MNSGHGTPPSSTLAAPHPRPNPNHNANTTLVGRRFSSLFRLQPLHLSLYSLSQSRHLVKVRDGHATKRWLAENVVPMLSKMVVDGKIDETPTVYIDTLLETRELSLRLESSGNLVEDWLFKKYKKSLRN